MPANSVLMLALYLDEYGNASDSLSTLAYDLRLNWNYSKGNLSVRATASYEDVGTNSASYPEVSAVVFENLVHNRLSPGMLKTTYAGRRIDFIHKTKMAR